MDDLAVVEEKYIFQDVTIVPEGKHAFQMMETYEGVSKRYKKYEKQYFKAHKVSVTDKEQLASVVVTPPDQLFYLPVDEHWQEEKCRVHHLELRSAHEGLPKSAEKMNLRTPPTRQMSILPDGNCFFRAIAFWITGSSEQHAEVRSMIVDHMKGNWRDRGKLIIGQDVVEYLEEAKMGQQAVWASEKEIFACADLLRTTIFVYTDVDQKHCWVPHNPHGEKTDKFLYLANIRYHSKPVLAI